MKRIATGNTADILEWNETQICKLFREGYPKEYIFHEFENASAVYRAGIRTPRAYEILSLEGRNGIIYEKITGGTFLQRMNQASDAQRPVWTARFAAMHKELLSHPGGDAVDYKEFLRLFAAGAPGMLARIEALEDGDCLLHGDFHPANVMVTAGDELVLIDMMNVCRGPAAYDVARTCFLLADNKPLCERYVALMGYSMQELAPYLDVISRLREKEMRL